jgi:PAS domain-containing protein
VDRAYKNSLLNGQSGYEIEHRIIRRHSGEIRHVVERCVHERDSKGTVIKSIGMVQDITSQVEAERALVESEKRFREVVHSLDAGVIVHAPDTSIIDCNDRASELLGLNKEQLLGKVAVDPAWRFINEDESPMPQEEFPINLIIYNSKGR